MYSRIYGTVKLTGDGYDLRVGRYVAAKIPAKLLWVSDGVVKPMQVAMLNDETEKNTRFLYEIDVTLALWEEIGQFCRENYKVGEFIFVEGIFSIRKEYFLNNKVARYRYEIAAEMIAPSYL